MAVSKRKRPAPKRNYSTFEQILEKGARQGYIPAKTQTGRDWFRDIAKSTTISANKLMSDEKSAMTSNIVYGKMYAFFYDPKHKKTLPYYDRFPLIFPIGDADKGFLGINLHYLPYVLRAKLMDELYSLSTNKTYNEKTKLRLSYSILNGASKFKYFKPCIKHYLNGHVQSRFLEVGADKWDIALFLPVEKFAKKGTTAVWSDSRRMVG